MTNKEKALGNKMLSLLREQRKHEVPTLNGHIVSNHLIHRLISNEIDILAQTISGRTKTAIRKECREQGMPYPEFKNHL
jgi:hypothetical protein